MNSINQRFQEQCHFDEGSLFNECLRTAKRINSQLSKNIKIALTEKFIGQMLTDLGLDVKFQRTIDEPLLIHRNMLILRDRVYNEEDYGIADSKSRYGKITLPKRVNLHWMFHDGLLLYFRGQFVDRGIIISDLLQFKLKQITRFAVTGISDDYIISNIFKSGYIPASVEGMVKQAGLPAYFFIDILRDYSLLTQYIKLEAQLVFEVGEYHPKLIDMSYKSHINAGIFIENADVSVPQFISKYKTEELFKNQSMKSKNTLILYDPINNHSRKSSALNDYETVLSAQIVYAHVNSNKTNLSTYNDTFKAMEEVDLSRYNKFDEEAIYREMGFELSELYRQ